MLDNIDFVGELVSLSMQSIVNFFYALHVAWKLLNAKAQPSFSLDMLYLCNLSLKTDLLLLFFVYSLLFILPVSSLIFIFVFDDLPKCIFINNRRLTSNFRYIGCIYQRFSSGLFILLLTTQGILLPELLLFPGILTLHFLLLDFCESAFYQQFLSLT